MVLSMFGMFYNLVTTTQAVYFQFIFEVFLNFQIYSALHCIAVQVNQVS